MAHTDYPAGLDLQCAQFVFQTIKDKTLVENKVKFAHCVWELTGFLLRSVVGIPEGHTETFGDTHPTTTFTHEEAAVLQCVCDECSDMMENPISLTDPDPISGFDIGSLITLIPIILSLLQALGIRWKDKKRDVSTEGPGHPVED